MLQVYLSNRLHKINFLKFYFLWLSHKLNIFGERKKKSKGMTDWEVVKSYILEIKTEQVT